jgi:hypothetical protein
LHFLKKFPEAPEVLFFCHPEFLIHVSPVSGRIMVQPVRCYSERVGHDYRDYFGPGFWSLWSEEGTAKTTPHPIQDTTHFRSLPGFYPIGFNGFRNRTGLYIACAERAGTTVLIVTEDAPEKNYSEMS